MAIFSPAASFFSPSVEAEAEVALVESAPVDASEEEEPLEEPHPASAAVVMAAASSKLTTINEQIQNIAQKKDTLCRRMYN